MARNRALTAHEILDALENASDDEGGNKEVSICILPPPVDPDCPTDEDSGEEDNVIMNNLPRNILLQPAEIYNQEHDPVSDVEEEPTVSQPKRKKTYAWRKRDIESSPVDWPECQGAFQEKLPIEWFWFRNMGRVDRSDENISHYRIGIRGKKWYMPLLTHMVDLCEHNAWQLYKANHGKLDHLGFRRRVATALIESNRKYVKRESSQPSQQEHADSRKDGKNHLVIPQEKQTRCRQCHKKCLTRCRKCDVGVCVKCFVEYHS